MMKNYQYEHTGSY